MATITIQKGDTLSSIAQKHGTTVADIMSANKGNSSVKNSNMIIAGGSLNIPDKVAAPAAGPTNESEPGTLNQEEVQNPGAQNVSELSNLRIALREAMNEAASTRVANNFQQIAPYATKVPGSIGSIVDMIRSGVKTPVETTFADIMAGYTDATEAKKNEIDRINVLREEYGSLIPSSVTSLSEALDLIAPTIDKERQLDFNKKRASLSTAQAEDDDIESWAQSVASGEIKITAVPSKIRTQVKVRSDAIRERLESEAKDEYKSRIAFRLEKKTSDFETERSLIMQDDNLTVAEQRDMIDYIDSLEQAQKASKKANGGFFSFLSPDPNAKITPGPSGYQSTPASVVPGLNIPSSEPSYNIFSDDFLGSLKGALYPDNK